MAANTVPIFSRVADIQWGTVATANTAKDGTGTVVTVFTADATNGGRVERLRVRALGSNILTVLRVFINNGSTNTTAANNSLYQELTLPATTLSETGQLLNQEIVFNDGDGLVLPPGYKLNVTLGTTVAAGYQVTAVGGKY